MKKQLHAVVRSVCRSARSFHHAALSGYLRNKPLSRLGVTLAVVGLAGALPSRAGQPSWVLIKNGFEIDLRSAGKQQADEFRANGHTISIEPEFGSAVPDLNTVPQGQLRRGNVQVNDGSLDNIQVFPGTRSFLKYTQSETTISVHGKSIVAGFNNSADALAFLINPTTVGYHYRHISGFATSNDGGVTWKVGSVPPVPGSQFTYGDPAVDKDRQGNFYYAGLGENAAGVFVIQVNKSTDGGRTWSPATVVQADNDGDKEWIAVGRDPVVGSRDNIYVTWSSFQPANTQLRFSRSTDGGATWQTKILFSPGPHPNPAYPQQFLQFTNPYVDPTNGHLYIPFLHFSEDDHDFIRMLISRDGGETFDFATFNDPTAPLPTLLTITQPGTLVDCGTNGNVRLAIHEGPNLGGRFGLPQYRQVSRLVVQPAIAAVNGVVYLAWSNSTSLVLGDPNSGAEILFIRSEDGGNTWSPPEIVNPTVPNNKRHVLPALSVGQNPRDVHIAYYTQHTDGTVDVDLATSRDGGKTFPANRTLRVTSLSTALAPTNVRVNPADPASTTNYDRTIRAGYNLGEYLSVRAGSGFAHVLWADGRNTVTHPVNPFDPLSGQTHPQQDVFYQKVLAP